MAATTPISLDETMVYHDLREWIAKQQAKRKPLNEIQLRAINDLLHSDEPEGDLDWNSVLNQYCQVHFAQGASVNYKDTGEPLKWLCTVIFKFASHSDPLPFPSLEAGFIADPATGAKAAPFWTRKKDAKKYAAKCCVEWLIAGGHVARDGGIPKAKARSVAPAVAIFNVKQENGSTTTAGSPQP
ncbi:hypothetical protein N0V88_002078 [Collariella sp. IMI 366227]|nr:hypothetical protein N0V88_002078 [Collariella sp. IMI 366227]